MQSRDSVFRRCLLVIRSDQTQRCRTFENSMCRFENKNSIRWTKFCFCLIRDSQYECAKIMNSEIFYRHRTVIVNEEELNWMMCVLKRYKTTQSLLSSIILIKTIGLSKFKHNVKEFVFFLIQQKQEKISVLRTKTTNDTTILIVNDEKNNCLFVF